MRRREGACGVEVRHVVASCDIGKVREERLRRRVAVEAAIADSERPAQKAPRAGRVDDEACADADDVSLPHANQHRLSARLPFDALEIHEIQVLGAERDRFVHQELIDVASQPVRIGQFVARARCHQQLIRPIAGGPVSTPRLVLEVREPPLQPAHDLRIRALPGSECRKRPQARQAVSIGQLLDEDAGQGRRRFPDGKSRMASRARAASRESRGAGRSWPSPTRRIPIRRWRDQCRLSQSHTTAGTKRCSRFITPRRAARAAEQPQSKKRSMFQRSANTRMPPLVRPCSTEASS